MATDPDTTYENDTYTDDEYDNEGYDEEEDDDSWWSGGLISLLLIGGVILFLFPEPATSGIGMLLVGAGLILWGTNEFF